MSHNYLRCPKNYAAIIYKFYKDKSYCVCVCDTNFSK